MYITTNCLPSKAKIEILSLSHIHTYSYFNFFSRSPDSSKPYNIQAIEYFLLKITITIIYIIQHFGGM